MLRPKIGLSRTALLFVLIAFVSATVVIGGKHPRSDGSISANLKARLEFDRSLELLMLNLRRKLDPLSCVSAEVKDTLAKTQGIFRDMGTADQQYISSYHDLSLGSTIAQGPTCLATDLALQLWKSPEPRRDGSEAASQNTLSSSVFLVLFFDKEGVYSSVARSEDRAFQDVVARTKIHWTALFPNIPQPADPEQLVDEFFLRVGDAESYEIIEEQLLM